MPASESEAPLPMVTEPTGALLTRRVPGAARRGAVSARRQVGMLAPARPWHLAAVRMRPVVRAVAAAVPDDDGFLGAVRYRVRDWNHIASDPLRDARRAWYDTGGGGTRGVTPHPTTRLIGSVAHRWSQSQWPLIQKWCQYPWT